MEHKTYEELPGQQEMMQGLLTEQQKLMLNLKGYQQQKMQQEIANGDVTVEDQPVSLSFRSTTSIRPEDLPGTIAQQFEKIALLEEKVKSSKDAAERAKQQAEDASKKSAGWFHKKAAIEAVQEATYETAEALGNMVESMEVSFDYQKQLGQITQYLFMLGVSNIATTRTVVQRLKLELQKAPEEQMSELARAEIMSVIQQLQAQEDMANRVEKQSATIKKLHTTLTQHEQKLNSMTEANETQRKIIVQYKMKIQEQEQQISQLQTASVQQARLIGDLTHQVREQTRKNEQPDHSRLNNVLPVAALISAVMAMLLAVVQLFL